MSNRSTIELNHDYPVTDAWSNLMANYIRSGDSSYLPRGLTLVDCRHHSDPAPLSDPERAAKLLRSLGWTIAPPADPAAGIPEPEVGQVWLIPPGAERTWSRKIVEIDPRKRGNFTSVVWRRVLADGTLGTRCYGSMQSIHDWARKTGARPATTGAGA